MKNDHSSTTNALGSDINSTHISFGDCSIEGDSILADKCVSSVTADDNSLGNNSTIAERSKKLLLNKISQMEGDDSQRVVEGEVDQSSTHSKLLAKPTYPTPRRASMVAMQEALDVSHYTTQDAGQTPARVKQHKIRPVTDENLLGKLVTVLNMTSGDTPKVKENPQESRLPSVRNRKQRSFKSTAGNTPPSRAKRRKIQVALEQDITPQHSSPEDTLKVLSENADCTPIRSAVDSQPSQKLTISKNELGELQTRKSYRIKLSAKKTPANLKRDSQLLVTRSTNKSSLKKRLSLRQRRRSEPAKRKVVQRRSLSFWDLGCAGRSKTLDHSPVGKPPLQRRQLTPSPETTPDGKIICKDAGHTPRRRSKKTYEERLI